MYSRRDQTHNRERSESGFTLLEMTIVVSIMIIMMALSYEVLQGLITSKQILDDKRDGMFIANSVLTRLSRELQLSVGEQSLKRILPSCDNIAPQSASGPGPQPTPTGPRQVIVGEEKSVGINSRGDTLTFLAAEAGQYVPDGGSHSGVVQITYRVEPDPDQQRLQDPTFLLIRDEMPSRAQADLACKAALRFPITKNLVALEFQYFDKKANEWTTSWTDQRSLKLPDMIQYKISLRSPGGEITTYTSAVALRDP
jgi:type II secretory pathway pseudopilin PulG